MHDFWLSSSVARSCQITVAATIYSYVVDIEVFGLVWMEAFGMRYSLFC